MLLVWPLFIFLLRWRAGLAAARLELSDQASSFIALEDAAEHADLAAFLIGTTLRLPPPFKG